MKKLLKFLLYVVLAIAVFVTAIGLFGKKQYHIERSMEINAPADMVFEYIKPFENFPKWSPWMPLDLKQTITIPENDGEVGATMAWKGNDKVGEGRQTIVTIDPGKQINYDMDISEPIKTKSPALMRVESLGEGKSKLHWIMEFNAPFPLNGFMMFTDVDAGMGKDFEMGLENIRRIVEAKAHPRFLGYDILREQIPQQYYYGVRSEQDTATISEFFAASLSAISGKVAGAKNPVGLYFTWENGKTDVAVAYQAEKGAPPKNLKEFSTPGGEAAIVEFKGPYSKIGAAHNALDAYLAENKLDLIPPVIEAYIKGPESEPDSTKWLTRVMYFTQPKK